MTTTPASPTALRPTSLDEVREALLSAPRVLPVGAGTKPRLSALPSTADADVARLSMLGLRGILEYDPAEFTFTAYAGTPLAEIVAALAERGQHMPWDPLLVSSGSTLGGAVASGLSGPGRYRHGGVRDFILGVRFFDGSGRLLRLGGKVVKNAAGFDLPKFLVGSLGRFGVLAEITFKVFPRPPATLTLRLQHAGDAATRLARIASIARARWELDAVDVPPGGDAVLLRMAGPAAALDEIARDVLRQHPGELTDGSEWAALREFAWVPAGSVLTKLPLTAAQSSHAHSLPAALSHLSCAGDVAYVAQACACGLTLRGDAPLWQGEREVFAIEPAVKQALDPDGRFPALA